MSLQGDVEVGEKGERASERRGGFEGAKSLVRQTAHEQRQEHGQQQRAERQQR